MCDYSLTTVKTRDARVGDKLTTYHFGTGTAGFTPQEAPGDCAVCVKPGTEIAFDKPILSASPLVAESQYKTAIFRQIAKEVPCAHHDALELPDGITLLLTTLKVDQVATVLQLPAEPKTEVEAEAQRRLTAVG